MAIVRNLAENGHLRRTIVIHLGTNGVLIQPSQCDSISRIARSRRRVFLVTVTGPTRYPIIRRTQNTRLRACADRRANTYLIDWYPRRRASPCPRLVRTVRTGAQNRRA
jgi:hypothetical protein